MSARVVGRAPSHPWRSERPWPSERPWQGGMLPPDERIHYGYGTLSGVRRRAYEEICSTIQSGGLRARLAGLSSPDEAFELVRMVRADHPEVHWLDRNVGLAKGSGYVEVFLERSSDVRADDDAALRSAADAFADAASGLLGDYATVKAAFSQVAGHTRYDRSACARDTCGRVASTRPYEATGALIDGAAVCQGFSKAVQLLLQRCGVMAALISGEARSAYDPNDDWGAHAWLAVRIDGRFCHVDPTWTVALAGAPEGPAVSYDYFGLTDRQIAATHRATSCPYPAPVCDSPQSDFYRREGLLLRAWDEARYADMVCRQLSAGRRFAAVKAANDATYRAMTGYVAGGGWRKAVGRALATTGRRLVPDSASYTVNDPLRILSLQVGEAR